MSVQISGASLRATFLTAAFLMALTVLGSFSVNHWNSRSVQKFENYTSAIKSLGSSLEEVELELSLRTFDGETAFHNANAKLAFAKGLAEYSAIRAYDADGMDGDDDAEGEEDDDEESNIDAALEAYVKEFGIDIETAAVALGIAGQKMPEALDELWEEEEGESLVDVEGEEESLEASIAEAFLIAGPLFQQGVSEAEQSEFITEYIEEMQEEIRPMMTEMSEGLDVLIAKNRNQTQLLMAGIAVFGCLFVAFITFGIFFPLEKRILADRVAIEKERQRAEAADKAKSEFLANMSHEIRTPMNGVMGMAELLSRTELNPKQKNFADVILNSGSALITIINDILDFSKIDSGQLTLDNQPFNLKAVVEEVASLVSTNVDTKELELIIRFHPNMPEEYIGDDGRIRQILMNMVGNAVKFTDAGHVLINVSGSEHGEDAELHIRVEDTGIGIPADQCQAVFEKFNQIDNSATRRFEGTGLGLAICQMLVEKMGGTIGAESELGRGSTFWFKIRLPIHQAAGRKRRLPKDITGSRVLIVDDNKVNREILTEQLESWGMHSVACSSALQGLSTLADSVRMHSQFDLIIMDYQMPEMDGFEATRRIRADSDVKHIPIVMLTSVCSEVESADYRRIGIQAHLLKPARSSQLFESIVDVISNAQLTKLKNVVEPSSHLMEDRTMPVETRKDASSESNKTRILVAEDNDVNQCVISEILDSLDYDFRVAENGKIACDLLPTYKPDVVLMDVAMPVMNGMEATAEIRRLDVEAGSHTVIIGLTANALKGDREKCLDAGMDDYVAKPVDIDQLENCIEKWVRQNKQSAAKAAG